MPFQIAARLFPSAFLGMLSFLKLFRSGELSPFLQELIEPALLKSKLPPFSLSILCLLVDGTVCYSARNLHLKQANLNDGTFQ